MQLAEKLLHRFGARRERSDDFFCSEFVGTGGSGAALIGYRFVTTKLPRLDLNNDQD